MEIRIKNYNYRNIFKDVSASFKSGNVYGLYGGNSNSFDKLINRNIKKHKRFIFFVCKKRKLVNIDICLMKFYCDNVKSEINYYCKRNNFSDKSFKKIIENYISDFGFTKKILDKQIAELSYSEKILFYIFINTLFDFDIIFFKNVFPFLDKNNRKIIQALFLKLKKEGKIIFVNEKDINTLYTISDCLIYFNKNKLCKSVNVKEYFDSIGFLVENSFDVPDKLLLIYLAKTQKNIKLTYLNDVRDIIKDIYKHV